MRCVNDIQKRSDLQGLKAEARVTDIIYSIAESLKKVFRTLYRRIAFILLSL